MTFLHCTARVTSLFIKSTTTAANARNAAENKNDQTATRNAKKSKTRKTRPNEADQTDRANQRPTTADEKGSPAALQGDESKVRDLIMHAVATTQKMCERLVGKGEKTLLMQNYVSRGLTASGANYSDAGLIRLVVSQHDNSPNSTSKVLIR